jgi:repressor LexA
MNHLNKREQEIFSFIKDFIAKHEYPPSYHEIAHHFQYHKLSTVFDHVAHLYEQGLIQEDLKMDQSLQLKVSCDQKNYQIPLAGTIAAGEPIEAIPTNETIQVPKDMYQKGLFALKVRGDSMVEEGIFDGDYVIIKPTQNAQNGDIVVALVNQEEATLKRFYQTKRGIVLKPANAKMRPLKPRKVIIQGKVVGIIRKFK